jgi:hypothetical protein
MQRRHCLIGALGALAGPWAHAKRRLPPPGINAPVRIKALRITTGPLTDGYRIAPDGRLNWYFINLGLIAIVQYLTLEELDLYVRRYIDLYLSRLESNLSIKDVLFNDASLQNITLVESDSENSYTATLVSLLVRYLRATSNWSWWESRKALIKAMVQANIVNLIKTNGLARVYQPGNPSPLANFGYMMNNAEDYRCLRDLATLLSLRGESTDANYFNSVAAGIAQAIGLQLWDTALQGFRTSDQDARADTTTFYAGCACQVFVQAFDVSECAVYFTPAYRFLNTYSPNWPSLAYDPFPWCVLGTVAAKRGDSRRALEQLSATDQLFQRNPALLTINELGFYQRTRSILNGYGEI